MTITTKQAILEEKLLQEEFLYQRITLPSGKIVGTHDRSSSLEVMFPDDLSGKTVLDVGCNYGYFCLEAKKRGADRVVGYDISPEAIRKARMLAECMNLDVEFHVLDVESSLPGERFDYILVMNLLHHLRDPLGFLRKIADLCRERLILEIATLGPHDSRKIGLSFLVRRFLSRYPIIYVPPVEIESKRQLKNYYITPGAVRNLLMYQRRIFASLDIRPSEFKGRFLAIAHRRRIGHLLLFAGPTAAGKRTLARELFARRLPQLEDRLGLDDPAAFEPLLQNTDLYAPGPAERPRLALRYDILRPRTTNVPDYEHDPALEVLACSSRVSIVTLFVSPAHLQAQLSAAERRRPPRRWSRRHRRVLRHYEDGWAVLEDYRRWFAFTAGVAAEHVVVLPEEGYAVVDAREFHRRLLSQPATRSRSSAADATGSGREP